MSAQRLLRAGLLLPVCTKDELPACSQITLSKPFPYRFVDRIEIQIFNRWGGLVFESTNPEIDWDGTNLSGDNLGEGAYFYQCKVYELVNNPDAVPIELEGYIQLIRGK